MWSVKHACLWAAFLTMVCANSEDNSTSNVTPRYIESIFVFDDKECSYMEHNMTIVRNHVEEIVARANSLFRPLNVVILVKDVVTLAEDDEMCKSYNLHNVVDMFVNYRANVLSQYNNHDYAHLFSGLMYRSGVSTFLNGMCTNNSVTVSRISHDARMKAVYVVRAISRLFGTPIDDESCQCPDNECLMNHNVTANTASWSSCSVESWDRVFEYGYFACTKNTPGSFYDVLFNPRGLFDMNTLLVIHVLVLMVFAITVGIFVAFLLKRATKKKGQLYKTLQNCYPEHSGKDKPIQIIFKE